MSATYNNQIEIVLFTNTRRNNPKAPTKTGTVKFPDGTTYEVSIWERVSGKGTPFESGVLKLPDPRFQRNQGGEGGYQNQGYQNQGGMPPPPMTPQGGVKVDF